MTAANPTPGALSGRLVLDMTQALAGPYLGMLLGDLGADVIKIERPGVGDQSRGWGPPFVGTEGSYFMAINRNKRSLTCNLKAADGQAILGRLLERADVLLTNERREAARQSAGFDYETVRRLNPRLVYCSITGYGMTGPMAEEPGYDIIAQGRGGLMPITGSDECAPMRYPASISDMATSLYGLGSVLAALYARDAQPHGQGQFLDLSLVESQAWWSVIHSAAYLMSGEAPAKLGNDHLSISPYGAFEAKDGYLIIGCGGESLWASLCQVIEMPALRDDPRFALNRDRVTHRDELRAILNDRLAARTVAEWCLLLSEAKIPSGPIYDVPQMLADEHLTARGFVIEQQHPTVGRMRGLASPLHLSETAASYRLPPPLLGQHTDQVLAELGYDPERIAALHAQGAV